MAKALGLNLDQINILLMIVSFAIAFAIPFELILISYAFLGPAHYLTEISWLHDRTYFTDAKWLWIPLAILSLIMIATNIGKENIEAAYIVLALSLSLATAFVFGKTMILRAVIFVGLALLFLGLKGIYPPVGLALVILLPTVIHVYVFTGLFILLGALKNSSKWGIASFATFLACGLGFFFVTPSTLMISPDFIGANLGFFDGVTDYLVKLFSFEGVNGHSVMAFLSFAYTYHYLNWFSKTEVIKWHLIPKKRLAIISIIYLISIGVYLIDFKTGLILLTFLSLTHVLLEFPLNIISIRTISQTLGGRVFQKS